MTAAEHYAAAVAHLEYAANRPLGDEANYHLATAQLHATLALVVIQSTEARS